MREKGPSRPGRITTRREILSLMSTGHRVRVQSLSFIFRRSEGSARRGVLVSRKIRLAVERNRVKRRIQEIIRCHPGIFMDRVDVIIRALPGSEGCGSRELKGLIEKASERISRRYYPDPD